MGSDLLFLSKKLEERDRRSELTHHPGQFNEIIHIIDNARSRAMKAVNAELIQMYWSVGAYLSELCSASNFGDKIIDEVAAYIAQENPGVKGFNRRGLYRMKQFYETYKDDEFVTPLVTQISWTNHLLILSGSKKDWALFRTRITDETRQRSASLRF